MIGCGCFGSMYSRMKSPSFGDPASGVVTGETMLADVPAVAADDPAAGGDRERTCVVILPCGSGFIKNRAFSTGLGLMARGIRGAVCMFLVLIGSCPAFLMFFIGSKIN